MDFKEIIEKLTEEHKTIATMESCTGGGVANAITNIEGASEVLKFSAVTYSNDYKIVMGVDPKVIDKYSVYSIETAKEMAKNISEFANSDYGVGITGKLNRADKHNNFGDDNRVFISIYDKKNNTYINNSLTVVGKDREKNKELVIYKIISLLEKKLSIDSDKVRMR